MTDIDEDYDGDLGPLLADLAALRSALGDSYRAFGEIHPDNDQDWQPSLQTLPSGAATQAGAPSTTAKPAPKLEPAPLPERLAAVQAALEANQSLQQRLQRLITSVNRAQDQAVGIRDRVRAAQRRRQVAASAPHALSARKRDQDQFTGISWFWSQPGAPAPPPYPGFSEIKTIVEVLPLVFPRRKWQEEERNALCEGVVQVVQERLLNKILADLETATPAPTAGGGGDGGAEIPGGGVGGISLAEFEARQAPIRDLTASSPQVIELAATLTEAEWATVAHRSVHGRTAKECSLQWFNAAQPTINHEEFTAEEDVLLQGLVEQYGTRSWPRIAIELQRQLRRQQQLASLLPPPPPPLSTAAAATLNNDTNGTITTFDIKQRTPIACMARYQRLLHLNRDTQEFTPADRQRLIQIVNKVGVQWKRVAEEFGGPWDYEQLMHQWRRHAQRHEGGDGTGASAAVVPRRGKWRPEEDEALLTAVALYGKKWSLVATLVPGRSDVQCRERYANCLDPGVNKEPWSVQEDDVLRENIEKFTDAETGRIKWARVADLIPGRTDYAAKKRWIALTSAESRGGGGGGGGGVRGAAAREGAASQEEMDAGTSTGNGSGGNNILNSNINNDNLGIAGTSAGASGSNPKKKEPVKRKKKLVQVAETGEEAIEATEPIERPPPQPRPRPRAPPLPPPPVVAEPEAAPVVTNRGRTVSKPSRFN